MTKEAIQKKLYCTDCYVLNSKPFTEKCFGLCDGDGPVDCESYIKKLRLREKSLIIIKKDGEVIEYEDNTYIAKVKIGDETFDFHSTSFDSGRPARFPEVGDVVEVWFQEDRLIRVFLKQE